MFLKCSGVIIHGSFGRVVDMSRSIMSSQIANFPLLNRIWNGNFLLALIPNF